MAKILLRSVAGFSRISYSLVKFLDLEVVTPPSGEPEGIL